MPLQTIHRLPDHIANQIAAGEVVERPASVVKELMENSVDAGATRVIVRLLQAGKRKIEVEDNGLGMSEEDATMAIERHATSKISQLDDLHRIASHGFRGEALPSIASVSRFRMQTCRSEDEHGIEVYLHGGIGLEVKPIPKRQGTRIEVLDLFLNTPARLHFMRSEKTEDAAVVDVFKSLALAHHLIAFRLECDGKIRMDIPTHTHEQSRIHALMGDDFITNSAYQQSAHQGIDIQAFMGLPTLHHRNASRMVFLLNGRVIREKALINAVRTGYRDVMFHDRYPVAVISISMDPAHVDINVHPSKREVRFKTPQDVYSAIVVCLRQGIESIGNKVSSTTTDKALSQMQYQSERGREYSDTPIQGEAMKTPSMRISNTHSAEGGRFSPAVRSTSHYDLDIQQRLFGHHLAAESPETNYSEHNQGVNLGVALAQLHHCYILTQTDFGMMLVDQHAAHERINYEKMKQELDHEGIKQQLLLVPFLWHVDDELSHWLEDHYQQLQSFGFKLKKENEYHYLLMTIPALLIKESPEALLTELIESCMFIGIATEGHGRILERWMGNRACKCSIKAGRALTLSEQNALLREMEKTPNIAQCNHGRPTYVPLSLNELDRLFGRKES
ncbi:MAG: DNA mismatch repair endonuclease MutL [Zetaproteobacteria bacterium]|nr:DNA mismatch repair endonuclease MutL [Zetaproteobacteria bacterium]